MAKKRKGKHAPPHRSATRRPAPEGPRHAPGEDLGPEAQELMAAIRRALRDDDPLAFVALVCSMIEVFTEVGDADLEEVLADIGDPDGLLANPRSARLPGEVPFSLAGVVESFVHTNIAETTAALAVLAELADDELVAARARRELANRRQPLPPALAGLAHIRPDEAILVGDQLDDGDNVIIGYTWPGGRRQTAVVYVDRNLADGGVGVAKDAFLIDEAIEEVVAAYRRAIADQGVPDRIGPVPLADARTIIEAALAELDETPLPELDPEDEADSMWPQCRPFVRHLARLLPPGGAPPDAHSPYRGQPATDPLAGFLASPFARGITAGTPAAAAAELLFTVAREQAGHALRWSPTTVEILMVEVLPWVEVATEEALDAIPDVLAPVIRYAHYTHGITPRATEATVASVARWLPDYQQLRTLDVPIRLRRSIAELQAFQAGDPRPYHRRLLMEQVGTEEALAALDAEPLPTEEFDLAAVPADIRDRVAEVVGHLDRFVARYAEAGLDLEFRTAAYRFLAAVTRRQPGLWRRAGRTDMAAAAVIWAVGRANDLVGTMASPVTVGQLQTFYGLSSSPSQRAQAMLKAIGVDPRRNSIELGLGDVAYLTARARAGVIAMRDELARQHVSLDEGF